MQNKKTLRMIKLGLFESLLDYQGLQHVPTTIKSAVIFVARHIGDTMAIYPVVRALQAAKVNSIILVVNPSSYAALAPLKTEGITLHLIDHERNKRAVIAAARKIRRTYGQVDLCVQAMMRNTTATLLFQRTLHAHCNIGLHHCTLHMYVPEVAKQAMAMLATEAPAPFCWAQLMKDAGIADVEARFELPIPQNIERHVRAQIAPYGPYFALNMDASRAIGSLNEETAVRLIQCISDVYGYSVIITCSPSGEEKARRVSQACPSAHIIAPPRSIYHSAAIIKHATAVISPDTSIIHIASAYNRPTLGIYRTEIKAWRPLADHNTVLVTGDDINAIDPAVFARALDEILPQNDVFTVK
ncbi:glycosyltransferase family 9 protein [Zymobacter palmae]|nr:glycosyltransferase family 9 protein [Zymobacter palmae]